MLAVQFTAGQWIVLIGTLCTGIATIITAYAAIVRAKKETRTADELECLERVKRYMLEAQALDQELYDLKKKYPEV